MDYLTPKKAVESNIVLLVDMKTLQEIRVECKAEGEYLCFHRGRECKSF